MRQASGGPSTSTLLSWETGKEGDTALLQKHWGSDIGQSPTSAAPTLQLTSSTRSSGF